MKKKINLRLRIQFSGKGPYWACRKHPTQSWILPSLYLPHSKLTPLYSNIEAHSPAMSVRPKQNVSTESLPLRAQETLWKWRQKEWKSQMGWRPPRKQDPHNYELTPAWVCTSQGPRAERGGYMPPPHTIITQRLSPTDNYLQMKI